MCENLDAEREREGEGMAITTATCTSVVGGGVDGDDELECVSICDAGSCFSLGCVCVREGMCVVVVVGLGWVMRRCQREGKKEDIREGQLGRAGRTCRQSGESFVRARSSISGERS